MDQIQTDLVGDRVRTRGGTEGTIRAVYVGVDPTRGDVDGPVLCRDVSTHRPMFLIQTADGRLYEVYADDCMVL